MTGFHIRETITKGKHVHRVFQTMSRGAFHGLLQSIIDNARRPSLSAQVIGILSYSCENPNSSPFDVMSHFRLAAPHLAGRGSPEEGGSCVRSNDQTSGDPGKVQHLRKGGSIGATQGNRASRGKGMSRHRPKGKRKTTSAGRT